MKIWLILLPSFTILPVVYWVFAGHVLDWEKNVSLGVQNFEIFTFLAGIAVLSVFGNYIGLIISFSTFVLVAFYLKGFILAVVIFTVSLSQFILIEILKITIGRPRPFPLGETAFDSFPSGQAFYSLVFFSVVCFILNPYLSKLIYKFLLISLCTLFIFTIGILRIHSGEHWPTDVIGSWIIGIFALSLVALAVKRFVSRS